MRDDDSPAADGPAEGAGAVGIVVQGGPVAPSRPLTEAFVWGRELLPAPSLPFGRWKAAVRAA
ncbi:MAG TPA: hypothetical protein VFX98_02905 [Longimicrobiaceae bacterium]|nr:hypothetical protein [Longimicrobiaceae bacterium]